MSLPADEPGSDPATVQNDPIVPEQENEVKEPQEMPQETPQNEPASVTASNVINVLLLGTDENEDGRRGRSDSIMIATVDQESRKLKLTSLMRDMYLPIPGRGENRINAAYAFGGTSLIMQTINENFDMNIEKYVKVNMLGFEKIIDIIGGIEIELTASEYRALSNSVEIEGYGLQNLSGSQALAYARLRSAGRDDFDRVDRQQVVITELFEKAGTISFFRLPGILSAILPYIRTNISTFEILSLGTSVLRFEDRSILRLRLPADGTYTPATIRQMMVLVPDISKNKILLREFLYGY